MSIEADYQENMSLLSWERHAGNYQWRQSVMLKTQDAVRKRQIQKCSYARSDFTASVIVSDDTDVLAFGMAFSSQLPCSLFIKSGTKTGTEYVDVKKAAYVMGQDKYTSY